ncbi:hypothetical protein [Nocardiopsis sp. NRRL B-16309]|uniref:hypothetical protein n=1 Tax=Nocardiopsis sp. NRRL B-16309 TaxID=1519494 RepID=UPI0006B02FBE|nr:hypothetical protein [Nocardiopsis sp. NRRL B-16309]KOX08808.1 hypothetical protein ADL05_27110 [Nocardiopsis sp. NRRL B-16309]
MRSPFLPLLAVAVTALVAVAALAWWLAPSESVSSLPEEVVVGESSGEERSGPGDPRPPSPGGPGGGVVPVPPPVTDGTEPSGATDRPTGSGPDATGPPAPVCDDDDDDDDDEDDDDCGADDDDD